MVVTPDGIYLIASSFAVMHPTKATVIPEIGQFNIIIPVDPSSAPDVNPQGNGFSIMKLTRNAHSTSVGRMGDNQPFSTGGRLHQDKSIVLYRAIGAHKRERLYGHLDFQNASELTWYKPEQHTGAYAQGFTSVFYPVVERYMPQKTVAAALNATSLIEVSTFAHDGQIVVQKNFSALTNAFAFDSGKNTANRMTLSINPKTGLFKGKVAAGPMNPNASKIMGVLLPDSHRGVGVWRAPGSDARVEIRPINP